jgi:GNAT superfamily N-acetyltransferase
MKVVDLPAEQEELYCQCLEEWSEDIKEAGTLKREWYQRMKDRGLRVKVSLDENGTIGGMIHYGPIENVAIQGENLYYVYCIWVHGYSKGRGNFQKRGMGKALLQAAEEDVQQLGAKGLVVWGVSIPVFMRASWFRKQSYSQIDNDGMIKLLWKRFSAEAIPPKWAKQKRKPSLLPGKVVVTCLRNGWCPGQNLACERAKRAAAEFKEKVILNEVDTFEKEVGMEWGASDALYVDSKQIRTGPPPSYEKIRKVIEKRVRRLA